MDLTKETFNKVIEFSHLVIIDFWADWCGPCKKVAPILQEIANEYGIALAKVHVDEEIELAQRYEISSIPTIMLFKDGVPVKSVIGAQPKHKLVKEFEEWI